MRKKTIEPAAAFTDEATVRFQRLRLEQKHKAEEVADGLIGIAQGLEMHARRLKENATQVRKGQYLADFAWHDGRNTIYKVKALVDGELPEEQV